MNDEQLLRYSRHILLDEIGIEGQERLLGAHALIIGVGGLGSPAALYLASAGIGRITLADGDAVELSNLQRQILHSQERLGQNKAVSGRAALRQINPHLRIDALGARLGDEALDEQIAAADVVLDCCDNFATRHAVNRACVRHKVPLVSGAAIAFTGQLAVFDPRRPDAASACYHCLFPEGEDVEETRCAVTGIFAPLTGIIGAMQAAEALKIVSGAGQPCVGQLLLLDARSMTPRRVKFGKDPHCPVCGNSAAGLPVSQ